MSNDNDIIREVKIPAEGLTLEFVTKLIEDIRAEDGTGPMKDLYKDAAKWGQEKAREELKNTHFSAGGPKMFETALYWTAWYAGRRASQALLVEAHRIGLTLEQYEALRVVAADVAYD